VVSRGEANDESDIDLIFEFKEVIGLMKLGGLIIDLEEALGKKVDVLRFCTINPQIRDHVLQEVKIIYEQGIKGEKNRVCTANGKPVCG